MNKSGYMTRALQARDPRFAQVLGRLGYDRRDMVAGSDPVQSIARTKPKTSEADRKTAASGAGPTLKIKRPTTSAPIPPVDDDDALAAARAEYAEAVGKRAFHGWNVTTLRARIAAAKGA